MHGLAFTGQKVGVSSLSLDAQSSSRTNSLACSTDNNAKVRSRPQKTHYPYPHALDFFIMILDRIRSVIDPFLEVDELRDLLHSYWHGFQYLLKSLNNRPCTEKISVLANAVLLTWFEQLKIIAKIVPQAWCTPIAARTKRRCDRLQKEFMRAFRNGDIEKQSNTAGIQFGRVMLGAVFDPVNIQHISTFAARMALYQWEEGKHVFKHGLDPNDVISLMEQSVPAVCISYKHTRRSRDGLPTDVARVQKAVTQTASQLSQERLLFWCDVIGRTPQGASWAQQGIDPYLCMPTLRIVSAELREEIDDSFWMTIERIAAEHRGGVLSYDEDTARLEFWRPDDGYITAVPRFALPFNMAKMWVAKLICNPILYYRRARCEDDKLEVLKYAWSSTIYDLPQNEAGLVELTSADDISTMFAAISIQKGLTAHDVLLSTSYLKRPEAEIIIGDEERFHGYEESLPAIKVFEPETRDTMNRVGKSFFWIRRVGSAVDNATDVICTLEGNMCWCTAMRLRVVDFEEHGDRFTGRVVSFRVATVEEEKSMTIDTSINKRISFR